MEILTIARALWRKPTGALLVALQIAISLAIVINAALFVHTRVDKVQRDNGMDTKNIIAIYTLSSDKTYPSPTTIDQDIETIRQVPGVISAAYISGIPESGSGSGIGIKNATEDNAKEVPLNTYQADHRIVEALGLTLIEGRSFQAQEVAYAGLEAMPRFGKKVLITRNVAQQLFPGESAVGKLVYSHLNEAAEVIGVIEHMHGAWPNWEFFGQVALFPSISRLGTRLLVRTEPGRRDALQTELEALLSQDQSRRLISRVTSLQAIRDDTYNDDIALAKLLLVVIALLTAISALGIVALASFTVKQRTRQIGTRRAIGARKRDILLYFFQENSLISLFA
ncbi:MAG: ABC transporter permease, partial [Cellvibrionaceae bacterium]|nr:ABC transporter permease [Cellvibrionaceae bacterium]